MQRRRLLKLLGGSSLAVLGGHAFLIEPRQLEVAQYDLSQQAWAQRPGTATNPPIKPIKLLQISDLHLRPIDDVTRRLATTINQQQADILLFTGDIIDRAHKIPILAEFLALLDPKLSKYAILGNWENFSKVDIPKLKATYQAYGCQLLINESVVHQQGDRQLLITGLDDTVEGRPDLAKALANVQPHPHHLVLAHAPDQRDRFSAAEQALMAKFQPQLILSGHTHGGQVTFLGFAPILPRGSGKYVQGWYRDRLPQLYVSRGLGGSGTTMRLGAKPEIAVFEWPLG
jgi:uncharacterized protein